MFLGGIMFGNNNKITLVVTSILCVLLVLEPTSDLTVGIISLPIKIVRAILGFGLGIVNWPMLIVISISAGVTFVAKTRTVDWAEVRNFFRSEEVLSFLVMSPPDEQWDCFPRGSKGPRGNFLFFEDRPMVFP